jgi:hypothetical protein
LKQLEINTFLSYWNKVSCWSSSSIGVFGGFASNMAVDTVKGYEKTEGRPVGLMVAASFAERKTNLPFTQVIYRDWLERGFDFRRMTHLDHAYRFQIMKVALCQTGDILTNALNMRKEKLDEKSSYSGCGHHVGDDPCGICGNGNGRQGDSDTGCCVKQYQ